ncbi:MAG: ferredoxin--NADP reductase [Cytophagales bacterium]|nr:ferredoxin--NADP reductase [Cytophagales bacterium]
MDFTLFKRRNRRSEKHLWPVKEIIRETAESITIVFDKTAKEVPYLAGQFLTLITRPQGKEERRSYSLCSSPAADKYLAVSVKRIPNGLVSNFLNDTLSADQKMEVLPPEGQFTYEPAGEHSQLALIAAGSGITPLMSILKTALLGSKKTKVFLLYSNKTEESIIFKKQLRSLQEKHGDRLHVLHTLTQAPGSWKGSTGRINLEKLRAFHRQLDLTIPFRYYLCGPEMLMESLEKNLDSLGVGSKSVFKEKFVSLKNEPTEPAVEQKRTVRIIHNGEEHLVPVEAGKTILEAALQLDIDLPHSCQSGLCTACRAVRASGKVKMKDTDGLSPEEIAQGHVLTCVSKPLTDDVTISYD